MDLPALLDWHPPELSERIPQGDMPGDKVEIGQEHIHKAQTLFPLLLKEFENLPVEKLWFPSLATPDWENSRTRQC